LETLLIGILGWHAALDKKAKIFLEFLLKIIEQKKII